MNDLNIKEIIKRSNDSKNLKNKRYKPSTFGEKSLSFLINFTLSLVISFLVVSLFTKQLDVYSSNKITSTINPFLSIGGVDSVSTISPDEIIDDMSFLFHISYILFMGMLITAIMSLFVGYSPGDRIIHLKLVMKETNELAGLNIRIIRALLYILDICFLLGLGCFIAFFNKDGRTLEDFITRTIIMKDLID